jgi:hypothetical protein
MKKNRDKATNPTITGWLSKDTHPQIPQIFLALGLILIVIYLFKSHQPVRSDREQVVDTPSYVWISNSSTKDAGLYLANHGQADGHSPTGGVAAIRYDEAGQAQQIPLPAKVANIFFLPIAINKVDKEMLCTLPGVGPVLADRIIAKRKEINGFKNSDDLLQVKGIGPRKLARIRQHIFIN